MDNIPVELLEVFFLQLPSLNDIQKCYNTNIKWQEIIKKLFSNKGTMQCHYYLLNFTLLYMNLTNIFKTTIIISTYLYSYVTYIEKSQTYVDLHFYKVSNSNIIYLYYIDF